MTTKKKVLIIGGIALILIISIFIYWRYFFVFGEGVKSGVLNKIELKGVMFKTYEGTLTQSGIRSNPNGNLESNTFRFSVKEKRIADSLMLAGGHEVDLHYVEYNNSLSWRGFESIIVDSIISIK